MNSSREWERATRREEPRHRAPSPTTDEQDERGDLAEGEPERSHGFPARRSRHHRPRGCPPAKAGSRTSVEDHGEVLDDEPAHGHAAVVPTPRLPAVRAPGAARPCSRPTARGRARVRPPNAPAPRHRDAMPSTVATAIWRDRARAARPFRLQASRCRTGHPDPEHQQDDADLGELPGQRRVADESRRERAHRDAGDEVTDERRQTQPNGDESADGAEGQADGEGRDERGFVMHGDRC